MKEFLVKYAHWVVFGVAAIWTVLETLPPSARSGDIDLNEFGKVPVISEGRVKPLDTVARADLLLASNGQEFKDENDRKTPAIRWLADALVYGDAPKSPAADYRVFRIENDQVLEFLKLPARPGSYRYSYNELHKEMPKFQAAVSAAGKAKEQGKELDLFQTKLSEAARRVQAFLELARQESPKVVPPQEDGGEWLSLAEAQHNAQRQLARMIGPKMEMVLERARVEVSDKARRAGFDPEHLKPEQEQGFDALVQQRAVEILKDLQGRLLEEMYPAAAAFNRILEAYQEGNAARFREDLADFRGKYFKHVPERQIDRAGFEAFLNHFTPFYVSAVMYICVFVLAALSWLSWPETFRKAAFWLAALTLAVHTFALIGRMYLMDRPMVFVTNLYSSAVFIAWGCVGIGLILEVIYRNSIGVTVGAVLGAISNLIAHNLLADGDTLSTLEPVLDTNFWLASHVTMVTLGYVATLVAGAIGALYILNGVFTPNLTRERARTLTSMLYGVLCFATFLSFTGTVLGGIWADQSWGRFWGWDPKENGAVLVVIWNVLILHARWGGMIKQRGMAVMSLVGFMITFWSWFGTNQLGVGLHAYGFSNKLATLCVVTWGAMAVLIAIGLLPQRYWTSRPQPAAVAQHPTLVTPGKGKKQAARASR